MSRAIACVFLRAACCLLPAAAAFAQTDTGTISGTISDPSGGVVTGAQIVARNQNTGLVFRTVSNESGRYVLSALPPGIYELSIMTHGFAKATRPDVVLNVQARLEVPFALQVGDVTEVVEVRAETPLLESRSSSVSQVVDNKTMVTLPLNGRNYSQLATLAPGVTPNQGSRATDGFSINGNRTFQNVFLIDGIDNNNYILGVDTNSTQAIRPSIDAIQEFRLETANYSAEFGRAAGGVISVSIKSGTNEFHGSAFEFLRNDKLDANNFFSNRAGLKRPPLRRNQFGGALGGPIARNRTFFFASYQGTVIREPQTRTTTVPIGRMATGEFGATRIFDPLNVVDGVRQPFLNNTIGESRLDSVGRRLAALYPPANQPAAINNFVANIANSADEHQGDGRIDHRISESDNLFVRFSKLDRENTRGSYFAPPGNGGNGFVEFPLIELPKAYSLVLNETHVFSPAIVNEFRAGYTRNASDQLSPSPSPLFEQFGIRGVPLTRGLTGLPTFSLVGFSQVGDRTFAPNPKLTQVRQFIDNLSWVKGSHTLKFGFDMRFLQNFAGTSNTSRGSFTFNGQFTSEIPGRGAGSALADLLLGQTSNATLTTLLQGDFRLRYYGYFFNDTWKANRKLTLHLGLRYELQSPPWEHNNNQSNFDLDPSSVAFGTLAPASGSSIRSRTFVRRDVNNWAPRVGFAYELAPRTVIRGAAGTFYGSFGYLAIAQMPAANVPNFISVSLPTANTAPVSALALANGFPPGLLDPRNVRNPNGVAFLPDWPLPEVYQWNLNVQREFPQNMLLSVAYVGSGSSYLPGIVDVNDPPPGLGAINPRRPFPSFGAVNLNSGFAHATYHSLQNSIEKHFSKGLALLLSYSWAHSIDNSTNGEDASNGPVIPQNPRNTRAEKAHSAIDVRHRLVGSFIYELPLGGKARSRAARALLGGWQIGGILTASSGVRQSPSLAPSPANTTGPVRPDRLRDGNLPRTQRTIDRWFDPPAFEAPQSARFGNSGRNVLQMPGLALVDAMLGRNFSLRERTRLELRAEFFNLTNTAQMGRPVLNVILRQAGQITTTSVPNRQMQIGLRLVF